MARATVEASLRIAAPVWAVWAMVGGFDLSWHPDIAACRVAGRVRHLALSDGSTQSETCLYRSATEGRIHYGLDGSDYRAEIVLTAAGEGARVIWRANPEAEAADSVHGLLQRGLAALAARLTPTPVRFGPAGRIAGLAAGQGPLVLLLHGIGGTKENWRDQLWALAPGHRALALDLQGYGDSLPTDGPMTLAGLMADLDLVLNAQGATSAHLVGLSFGAWLAASYATRHPARVASLTCSGGFLGMTEAPKRARTGFLQPRLAPLDAGRTPGDLSPDIWPRLRGPAATPAVEAGFLASMAAIPAASYRKALHCFTSPPFTLDLACLSMPVLAMTGAHDALASPTEIAGVVERIRRAGASPHVRFEVIDGAGHLCNMEQPRRYNRHLTRFLVP